MSACGNRQHPVDDALVSGREAFDQGEVRFGRSHHVAEADFRSRSGELQAARAAAHGRQVASACQRVDDLHQRAPAKSGRTPPSPRSSRGGRRRRAHTSARAAHSRRRSSAAWVTLRQNAIRARLCFLRGHFARRCVEIYLMTGWSMTFVVTENCIKCKYTDCVEVCPVDCFYEAPTCSSVIPTSIDCGRAPWERRQPAPRAFPNHSGSQCWNEGLHRHVLDALRWQRPSA